MKNQNDSLENQNLFLKVKSWLYNIFHNSQLRESKTENIESINIVLNEAKLDNKPNNFRESYAEKNERRQYILDLQRKYKNKEILEENMSDEDRFDLENLYEEQNTALKRRIKELELKIEKSKKMS